MLLKELIEKLEKEAKEHHKFSKGLSLKGDDLNSQYQDGVGDGITYAIKVLKLNQEEHLENIKKKIK